MVQESIADLKALWGPRERRWAPATLAGAAIHECLRLLTCAEAGPRLRTVTQAGTEGRKVGVRAESPVKTGQRTSSRSWSQAIPQWAGQAVLLSVWTPRGGEDSRGAEFFSQPGVLGGWSEVAYSSVPGVWV